MRTLFLTAKKFAIDEKSETIRLEHIKQALGTVEFIDEKAEDLIYKFFKLDPTITSIYTNKNIDEASKHATVAFDKEVLDFKNYLEGEGFAINTVVSKLFIEKKNALASFKSKIAQLEESLSSQVFGQDAAIEAICDKIVESSYNISNDGPKGIYFFLGPPATGKTMLSEIMGKELDGFDGFKIFDMTQYVDEESGFALFGSEAVYKDSKEGKLTKYVKENPNSVIVFDEIEKNTSKCFK